MRIIYLHQYFKTPDQAGGTRSYEMARRFVKSGHEVHLITSWTESSEHKTWYTQVIDGIQIHWLPVKYSNKMGFLARLRAFISFAVGAALRASKLKADVVFATSTPLTIALPGIYAAYRNNCPLVFEVRDLWPDVPIAMGILKNAWLIRLARLLEKAAYKKSARVVALSDGMARGVVAAGTSPDKVSVIPNSADLELFDPDAVLSGEFRSSHPELPVDPFILYPGTLGQVNGVKYLVDVACALREKKANVSFVIIGDGAERESIKTYAATRNVLNGNFFMYDPISKRNLVHAFKDASMVISTVIDNVALEANSANKIFDGMAAGKSLAINHSGWQKNLIEDYKLGLVLSRNAQFAADQIIDFFADSVQVRECGRRARAVAESQFSRDDLAGRLEQTIIDAVYASGNKKNA